MSEDKQDAYYNIVNEFSQSVSLEDGPKEAPFPNPSLGNASNQEMAVSMQHSPDDTSKVVRAMMHFSATDCRVTSADKQKAKSQQMSLSTPEACVASSSIQRMQSFPLPNPYANECEYMDQAASCHAPSTSRGAQGREMMHFSARDRQVTSAEIQKAKYQQMPLSTPEACVASSSIQRTQSFPLPNPYANECECMDQAASCHAPSTSRGAQGREIMHFSAMDRRVRSAEKQKAKYQQMPLSTPEACVASSSIQRMQSFPLPNPYANECEYMDQAASCHAPSTSKGAQGREMMHFSAMDHRVTSAAKQKAKSQRGAMHHHLHSIKSTIVHCTKQSSQSKYPFMDKYRMQSFPLPNPYANECKYMDQTVGCNVPSTSRGAQCQCKITPGRSFKQPPNLVTKKFPRGLAAYLAEQKRISDHKAMTAMSSTQATKGTKTMVEQNVGNLLWTVQKKEEAGTSRGEGSTQDKFPITRPPPELKVGTNRMMDDDKEFLLFSISDDEDTK